MAGFGATTKSHTALLGLTYTRMFTPALSNEARIGFARNPLNVRGVHQGQDFPRNSVYPRPQTWHSRISPAFPLRAITFWETPRTCRGLLNDTSYKAADTLTWVKGTHLVKFGAEYVHTMFNQPTYNFAAGQYTFGGFWTGNAYSDFLLGLLNTDQRSFSGTTTYLRQTSYGFFAQDDWKITRRLTLNLGHALRRGRAVL